MMGWVRWWAGSVGGLAQVVGWLRFEVQGNARGREWGVL
jgi:hypothetical protein